MNLDYLKEHASDLCHQFGSPLYVYEERVIKKACQQLKLDLTYPKTKLFYACKANTNIAIMQIIRKEGFSVEVVSPEEAQLALLAGFKPDDILYTMDNATLDEIRFCIDNQLQANLGSLSQLEQYGKMNPGSKVCIRINPDCGDAHHSYNITGGPDSKFGIYYDQNELIQTYARKYQLKIVGLHSHIGSGILDLTTWNEAVEITLSVAQQFSNLEFIDFGGGLGVPYKPNQKELDTKQIGQHLNNRFTQFCQSLGRELHLYLEPGRFLVAQSGALIVQVTTVKSTPKYRFVGTNSGFHHLLRPLLYNSYHHIINCSNPDGPLEDVLVSGNICESGDVFTQNAHGLETRQLNQVREGDYLAILDAGAYGFAMASNYNSRCRPAEVLIQENHLPTIIRYRETINDITCKMRFS